MTHICKPSQRNGKNKWYYNLANFVCYGDKAETKVKLFSSITLQAIHTWRQCSEMFTPEPFPTFYFPWLKFPSSSATSLPLSWLCVEHLEWWLYARKCVGDAIPTRHAVLSWSSAVKGRFWSVYKVNDKCYFLLELMNLENIQVEKYWENKWKWRYLSGRWIRRYVWEVYKILSWRKGPDTSTYPFYTTIKKIVLNCKTTYLELIGWFEC